MTRPFVPSMLSAALLLPALAVASSEPVRTDHLQSRIVAESTAAVPGTRLTLGLLLEHDPHWHTYWRNPGDSGLPTELELELPDGVVAEPIAWPHPHRFELSEIVNFGFEGRQLLPVTLAIPAGYAAATLPVRAKANWLICEEECIPGKAEYAFALPVAAEADADARWADDFAAARAAIPQAANATLAVSGDGDAIVLTLPDPAATPARWQWFPETPNVVANGAGPQWRRLDTGWQARWPKSEYFTAVPGDVVFVAVDDAASAWRFAGIGTAAAATPAAAGAATASGAAADANPGEPFGRSPVILMAIAAVLFAVTIAIVVHVSRSRATPPTRPEDSDR